MNEEKNICIGFNQEKKEGFLYCDDIKSEDIDLVCKPWELSFCMMEVNYIFSKNLLQYLTNYEADRTLRDWLKSLKTYGMIEIIIPNMDYYCNLWLNASWNEEELKDKESNAKLSFEGLWGNQENCDPWGDKYSTTYKKVIKSGYNKNRIELLLNRIGFIDISIELIDKKELVVKAKKPKYNGERQIGTKLDEIRKDHLNRYIFASNYIIKPDSIVTDAACGVGYGSFVLAQNSNTKTVQSLDISNDALTHAKKHFNDEKIKFIYKDLENESLNDLEKADYYISFETIEHLPTPEKYIEKISKLIKDDGVFIGSTPNEEIMPFNQQRFLYHTRHFTQKDLVEILRNNGFSDIEFFQQKRAEPSDIKKIEDGQYIIFVAKK